MTRFHGNRHGHFLFFRRQGVLLRHRFDGGPTSSNTFQRVLVLSETLHAERSRTFDQCVVSLMTLLDVQVDRVRGSAQRGEKTKQASKKSRQSEEREVSTEQTTSTTKITSRPTIDVSQPTYFRGILQGSNCAIETTSRTTSNNTAGTVDSQQQQHNQHSATPGTILVCFFVKYLALLANFPNFARFLQWFLLSHHFS